LASFSTGTSHGANLVQGPSSQISTEQFIALPEVISPLPYFHKSDGKSARNEDSACVVTGSLSKNELQMALRRKEENEK
jgi:hypothetical protein